LEAAKLGAIVLIVTSWTAQELIANLPAETLSLIRERKLHICVLDVRKLFHSLLMPFGKAWSALSVLVSFYTANPMSPGSGPNLEGDTSFGNKYPREHGGHGGGARLRTHK
jgi:hypothetical protein